MSVCRIWGGNTHGGRTTLWAALHFQFSTCPANHRPLTTVVRSPALSRRVSWPGMATDLCHSSMASSDSGIHGLAKHHGAKGIHTISFTGLRARYGTQPGIVPYTIRARPSGRCDIPILAPGTIGISIVNIRCHFGPSQGGTASIDMHRVTRACNHKRIITILAKS